VRLEVPAPVTAVWRHRYAGPALRIAVFAAGLPLAIDAVFSRNPPLGILINGMVIGSLYGLIAVGWFWSTGPIASSTSPRPGSAPCPRWRR